MATFFAPGTTRFSDPEVPRSGSLATAEHFLDFASLLRLCHARSRGPVSPSAGNGRPTRRSRRRALRRGRIRAGQAIRHPRIAEVTMRKVIVVVLVALGAIVSAKGAGGQQ